ncbi:MAG: GDP-mannose 4,6-dehydratase [Bacteroidia bacterium]|nr:MAG: GDP-mannose 4,6-dehydratase [Bacteroidia bacterium]
MEGDLRSYNVVCDAVKGVDYIFHQGALPSVPRSVKDPITTNDVNILGTLNVLEAAKRFGIRRVVYASSSSVYGNSEVLPKTEDMPVNPVSPYALSKYTGERYCQIYYQLYGLETVILRYFNVFGPNQDPESQYSAVIPQFIKKIIQGKQIRIYGDGNQSRDFTYVENVVHANLLAAESTNVAGEIFNVGLQQQYSLNQLVETLFSLMGQRAEVIYEQSRPGDVKHSCAGIYKIRNRLNFEPLVFFEEGLSRTIASFFSNCDK